MQQELLAGVLHSKTAAGHAGGNHRHGRSTEVRSKHHFLRLLKCLWVAWRRQCSAAWVACCQGVKRIRISCCGCMTGRMYHGSLKYGCLPSRPRIRQLLSYWRRARCCWQGKPASAATRRAPLFAEHTVQSMLHQLLLFMEHRALDSLDKASSTVHGKANATDRAVGGIPGQEEGHHAVVHCTCVHCRCLWAAAALRCPACMSGACAR